MPMSEVAAVVARARVAQRIADGYDQARVDELVLAAGWALMEPARNRELATERLVARLAEGLRVERPRRPTAPTKASRERRLESKRRRSTTKRLRGGTDE